MTDYMTGLVPSPEEQSNEPIIPSPGVSDPWSGLTDPEAGIDPQGGATTATQDYSTDQYGNYGDPGVRGGYQYINKTRAPSLHTAEKPSLRDAMKGLAVQGGYNLAGLLVSTYFGGASRGAQSYGTSSASGPGASSAAQHNYGYGGGEGGAQGSSGQSGTSKGSLVMSAYAGYQAAPVGAVYARESGDPSPYYAGNAEGGMFQTLGGRSDSEANQAHGERTSMSAAGFAAGAMGGGWQGGLAGAVGAQFAENPYTGKRGYQEEWRYNIKPVAMGIGRDAKNMGGNIGNVAQGKSPQGFQKGGWMKNVTNFKNYGRAFDFHAGPGPKPPKKSEMRRDIQYGMAKNVQMDYNIRTWWNEIATKGGKAGRDFAMSALQEEGRTRVDDENLPNYMKGSFGSSKQPYDYRPAEIEGQRVANREAGGYLAALQKEYESMGNREEFWNKYMKDFSIYKEGGTPLTSSWHGKELYRIPSEVSGSSFQDLFPGLEVPTEYDENYWLSPQVIEEEENV